MDPQTTETTPKVAKAADIIANHLEKFQIIKSKILSYNKGAQEAYDKLRNDEEINFDLAGVGRILSTLVKNNKRRRNLYLSNHAKMTLNDPSVGEVIGDYKMWHEKADQVELLQKEILDAIATENETIKIFGNIRDILEQQKPKEPATETQPATTEEKQ